MTTEQTTSASQPAGWSAALPERRLVLDVSLGSADLATLGTELDIGHSRFGAFGLYPTRPLLELIHDRLTTSGSLVCSIRVGDGRSGPRQEIARLGGTPVPLIRYEHSTEEWWDLLAAFGFHDLGEELAEELSGRHTATVWARRPV